MTSRLENWHWHPTKPGRIRGEVYDDDRFEDGEIITTSTVEFFSLDYALIRTRNSYYTLGVQL